MNTVLRIIISLALIASAHAADWQTVQAPGVTKQTSGGALIQKECALLRLPRRLPAVFGDAAQRQAVN